MKKLSCCGTDCSACSYYGTVCVGCKESTGKPFHVPQDETCPIYTCAVKDKKYKDCSKCTDLPCPVWRDTRDPAFSDEAFEANINQRIANLKGMPGKENAQ